MTSQFVKGLQILCKASNRSLDEITCDIYLEHIIGREDIYLNALRKFYKENIGRPRLPSLDELDELAFGKKLKSKDYHGLAIAEYINLVRQYGRYEMKKVRELVGLEFFNSVSRIKNFESLCNANEFEVSEFKREAKAALQRDAETGLIAPDNKFLQAVVHAYSIGNDNNTWIVVKQLEAPQPEPPQEAQEPDIHEVEAPNRKLTPQEYRDGLNAILKGINVR